MYSQPRKLLERETSFTFFSTSTFYDLKNFLSGSRPTLGNPETVKCYPNSKEEGITAVNALLKSRLVPNIPNAQSVRMQDIAQRNVRL
jgi:hypothetical protein